MAVGGQARELEHGLRGEDGPGDARQPDEPRRAAARAAGPGAPPRPPRRARHEPSGRSHGSTEKAAAARAVSRRRTGAWASASTPAVVASAAGDRLEPADGPQRERREQRGQQHPGPRRRAAEHRGALDVDQREQRGAAADPEARATSIGGRPTAAPSASTPTSSGLLKPSTGGPPGFHTNPCPPARFSA